jgi:NADH-quinone oxidoreductase subunit J
MTTLIVLLALLLAAGLFTVMVSELILSAIGLAVVSAILTLVLFQLGGPLAAVFELSVCAGLITVVFIATISLTARQDCEDSSWARVKMLKRLVFLPILLALVGLWLALAHPHPVTVAAPPGEAENVRQVLWSSRRVDLFGQILIILAGVFGVAVLFKRHSDREEAR